MTMIDIGGSAIDRPSNSFNDHTYLTKVNPANADGILDTIQVWCGTNIVGLKAGTWTFVSGTNYYLHDFETIGAVTSGSQQTFSGLSIDVSTGDVMGCYFSAGSLDFTNGSGDTYLYLSGDRFTAGTKTFTADNVLVFSLYGTGWTPSAIAEINGVTWNNIAEINGITTGSVAEINGVTI